MPAVSPTKTVNAILSAFRDSGASAYYVSDNLRSHPRRFDVQLNERTYSIWIYVWSLTHGGRVTLPDEYRIQMTSVKSPLPINPWIYGNSRLPRRTRNVCWIRPSKAPNIHYRISVDPNRYLRNQFRKD